MRRAPDAQPADTASAIKQEIRAGIFIQISKGRAKVARIYDALTDDAMPADQLKRVHAPIGLDIGAVTPQEIAVSILAELIAVKHGKLGARDAARLSMQWNNLDRSHGGTRNTEEDAV